MISARPRIALVSEPGEARTVLAAYLESAGFDVHACDELAVPAAFGALVAINGNEAVEDLVTCVRSWIKRTKIPQVVVVTPKPTQFKELVAASGHRLRVLPAPAFGWELVDALRSQPPSRPRSA